MALYEAKRLGRGMTCVFDAQMLARMNHARDLELEICGAPASGVIEPWFPAHLQLRYGPRRRL